MKSDRALALLAPAAALVAAMLSGCSRVEQAPAVSYTLLDGRRTELAALRGHVVLVNFWATDCAPCVEEMPAMVANWRRFSPQGFETLAVAMQTDPPALVSNFAQARALPFGVVIDNTGEVARRLGNVQFTPTSLLINKRGEIVKRWVGKTDFEALAPLIAELDGRG
ncbi:TlpA disulfide reductase family protein [Scleromatobacter humisilvae]|uniref:TlpA family protein disulfide reductase n=1 Tax=Scleromatobacter humisilvae TaxID=2897159 RepID=A0A9X2C3M5_9BURK|nr:TlpA disulfide reductase family protein [Scleromatobacter humisilvae]MCK9687770.1 TlpA family protein disulfide reductase [Scleromatobacter humisilvae]